MKICKLEKFLSKHLWIFFSSYIIFPISHINTAFSLCRRAIENYLINHTEIEFKNLPDIFYKEIPVFVSLKKDNQPRGCAGSFQTEKGCFVKDLVYFSIVAATKDFRYKPIDLSELKEIRIQITIPEKPVEIENIFFYNPEKEGLIVEKNGKQTVILPKEAKTSKYALKMALRNAGINDSSNIRLFKFKAHFFIEGGKNEKKYLFFVN
jgi:AMMECR1 domain-containing protein